MNLSEAMKFIEYSIPNKLEGLPDEVFYFISRMTPLVNVDLLIQDESGRTLLAWRDDKYCGTGWHIPGGIIRYKEHIEDRIKKVAMQEIGGQVQFDKDPIAINELILPNYEDRAHFVSLLIQCYISSDFVPVNEGIKPFEAGYVAWHDSCPSDLIEVHNLYKKYMEKGVGNA